MFQAPFDRRAKRSVVVYHVNKARHVPLLAVNQNRQKTLATSSLDRWKQHRFPAHWVQDYHPNQNVRLKRVDIKIPGHMSAIGHNIALQDRPTNTAGWPLGQ
jgi:hypothetical protein